MSFSLHYIYLITLVSSYFVDVYAASESKSRTILTFMPLYVEDVYVVYID